jgi:hypothetical protein
LWADTEALFALRRVALLNVARHCNQGIFMHLKPLRWTAIMAIGAFMLVAQASAQTPTARSIAREAFIYGFPMVAGYETLYKQAVDREGTDFKAPFNAIGHSSRVATPQDKQFVTPNSDTPYSYVWMDLRAEPVVITMPKIDKGQHRGVGSLSPVSAGDPAAGR